MKKRNCLCTLMSVLLLIGSAPNTLAAEPRHGRWFSLTWDNDFFTGTDGGYTNGLYFSWYDTVRKPSTDPETNPWYYRLQRYLVGNGPAVNSLRSHSIGQSMATPSNIEAVPPDENDIPYAGILFWQGSVLVNHGRQTNYSTLYLGIVGPASLAEPSQKLVHRVTDSTVPQGWDYQLHNEPLLAVRYGQLRQNYAAQLGALEYDIVTGIEGALGNVGSDIGATVFVRVGSQLASTYSGLALVSTREINPSAHSGGWFAYVGIAYQHAFNNIVLDGNTFRDSPSVEWEHGSGRVSLGLAGSTRNWGYSINYTDLALTDSGDIGQRAFGSFSVLYRLR